eukprot:scaffold26777_cov101-Isochrysis_galbana.AAC.7
MRTRQTQDVEVRGRSCQDGAIPKRGLGHPGQEEEKDKNRPCGRGRVGGVEEDNDKNRPCGRGGRRQRQGIGRVGEVQGRGAHPSRTGRRRRPAQPASWWRPRRQPRPARSGRAGSPQPESPARGTA